jgi:hypothetical protein
VRRAAPVPDVVDDQQTGALRQLLAKLKCGVLYAGKAGPLAGEGGISGDESAQDVGRLAERDPEDAVIEVLEDIFVMAQRRREGGLAEAAGAG